jgi:MFS family permease
LRSISTLYCCSQLSDLAFIAYWGIVLFGYDTGIAGGVVSQPAFRREFGLYNADNTPNTKLITKVSSNVVSVLQAGAFFGALGSAPISSAIGRRYTLVAFSLVFLVGAILTTVSGDGKGLGYIYAGRVISGLGIGGISAVAPAFVSECSPKAVRGRITGLFQIMVAIGVLISYFLNCEHSFSLQHIRLFSDVFVVDGIAEHLSNKGAIVWRLPFGFQIVPNAIMLFGLFTVKESPRWLVSKDRNEEALKNLAYLRKRSTEDPEVIEELAEIQAALAEEREARAGLGLKEAFLGKGNFIR